MQDREGFVSLLLTLGAAGSDGAQVIVYKGSAWSARR